MVSLSFRFFFRILRYIYTHRTQHLKSEWNQNQSTVMSLANEADRFQTCSSCDFPFFPPPMSLTISHYV